MNASVPAALAFAWPLWPCTRSRRLGISVYLSVEVGHFAAGGVVTFVVFQDAEAIPDGFPEDNAIPEERLHEMQVTIRGNEILRFLCFLNPRVGRGAIDDYAGNK